jgi:hypothetical protein
LICYRNDDAAHGFKNKQINQERMKNEKSIRTSDFFGPYYERAIAPVYAGGDKVQHGNGAENALGPGDDAQDNQV